MTEKELYAVLDAIPEAIQVVDKQGTVIYVNPAWSRCTTQESCQALGADIRKRSPGGALIEVLQTGKPVFGKVILSVEKIPVICSAAPIMDGDEINGAVVVFRNIPDLRRLTEKLEESQAVLGRLRDGLKDLAAAKYQFSDIVGISPLMRACIDLAERIADADSTVLLTGESGTGKELFAHSIHRQSRRAGKPFIKVNCAAIPDQLLESELFGYEKGAFTGAGVSRMGKAELAQKGTLFLDEIGDMPLALQAKILRVLQEKEVERLGGSHMIPLDIRIIAATNRNLADAVRQGRFREDLYYRLQVIPISLPPLRQRREDIPLLAASILDQKNRRYQKRCQLTPAAAEMLLQYPWPGNVRELDNVLERAVLMADSTWIDRNLILLYPATGNQAIAPNGPRKSLSLEEERQQIMQLIDKHGLDVSGKRKIAAELGLHLSTLYKRMEQLGISYRVYQNSPRKK